MTATHVITIDAPVTLTRNGNKPMWINANDRLHWTRRRDFTAAWRTLAKLNARNVAPMTGPVHITATFHKTRAGRWDAANLYPTAKAAIDGLVDAGVLVDDSNEYVIGPDMRAGEKRDVACLVLALQEVAS